MLRLLAIVMLTLMLLSTSACKRAYDVGDHVLVEWEGEVYPAMIIDIPGPGKVKPSTLTPSSQRARSASVPRVTAICSS